MPFGPRRTQIQQHYDQELAWQECGDGECAELQVPMSYEDLDGPTVSLHVSRRPADGESQGPLVLDRGEAEALEVPLTERAEAFLSAPLLEAYDVVSVERRGVELDCYAEIDVAALLAAAEGPTSAQEAGLAGCAADVAELGPLDTLTAARDLEVLRGAWDVRQLNFLARSSGSYLALTYSELHPEGVRRVVLDGGYNPALPGAAAALGQAQRYEEAFTSEQTGDDFTLLTGGTTFEEVSPELLLRAWARHCLDRPLSEAEQLEDLGARLQEISPTFGPWFAAREALCQELTAGAEEPRARELEAAETGPVVVIATTDDPHTLPEWSLRMSAWMLPSIPFIRAGEGHGSYGENDCASNLVEDYLLNGVPPALGTEC